MTQKQIDAIKPGDILFSNEREEWGWTTRAILVCRVEKDGDRTYVISAADDGCSEFNHVSTAGTAFWDKLRELIPVEGYCDDASGLSIKPASSATTPYNTMLTYYARTAYLPGKLTLEKLSNHHKEMYGL